jgi:hypothetical protein
MPIFHLQLAWHGTSDSQNADVSLSTGSVSNLSSFRLPATSSLIKSFQFADPCKASVVDPAVVDPDPGGYIDDGSILLISGHVGSPDVALILQPYITVV